jgi:FAD/FMN-containing dehydrogenase
MDTAIDQGSQSRSDLADRCIINPSQQDRRRGGRFPYTRSVQATVLAAFRSRLRGTLLLPSDQGYGNARLVWNGAIDRRPSAIVICADAEDTSFAVRVAADNGLPLTVRGGGHNVAGRAIRDDVLMLDLSKLRQVSVNSGSRIASVQGGALWRDVDGATAAAGLATTGGLISSTGVGGFTLGGGAGWLMRKHGLACDNLRAAGMVLADGRFVRVSADEHADLFWGLRGGTGGLGVVTSFEFQLHPQREVLAGLVIHAGANALAALRAFRDYAAEAPDEFCGMAIAANAPPLPFLDHAWHGRPVVAFGLCWCGDVADGEKALAPLRAHGKPLADHIGPMPYARWQQMQDPAAPAGRQYYWKTANYMTMSEATLQLIAAAVHDLPTPQSEIHLQHMGGAVGRYAEGDSAFAHRKAAFFINVIGASNYVQLLPSLRDRVRELHANLAREASAGTMANFSDQDDNDPESWFGRPHAERLRELRRRYDPAGIFTAA